MKKILLGILLACLQLAGTAQVKSITTGQLQVKDSILFNGVWVKGIATNAGMDSAAKKLPSVSWVMDWVATHAVTGSAGANNYTQNNVWDSITGNITSLRYGLSPLVTNIDGRYVRLYNSYANPSWLSSLATSKLTGKIDTSLMQNSGAAAGVYGGAGQIPQISIDIYGRVLSIGSVNTTVNWANVIGLPSTFTPSAHTQALSSITQSGAGTGQVPQWNGSAWVPATVSGGGYTPPGDNTKLLDGTGAVKDPTTLPVSTAQQAALNIKLDSATVVNDSTFRLWKNGSFTDKIIKGGKTRILVDASKGFTLIGDTVLSIIMKSVNGIDLAGSGNITVYSPPGDNTKLLDGTGAVKDPATLPVSTAQAAAIALKADISHTQALSSITQSGAGTGQVPQWNGSAWVPATVSGGGAINPTAYLDVTRPPYNLSTSSSGTAVAQGVQAAIDSLSSVNNGGDIIVPFNFNWGRKNGSSQKGVSLRPNIHVKGFGNTLTMTDNCAFFSTDFGPDSLGTEINAPLDSSMTNIQVVSSAGFAVGDTVYGRFGTAAYDAFEPAVFGWFIVTAVPNSTHITLNRPCGANMAYTGSSLNRRLIRVHKLVTNASIEGFNLVSPQSGGAIAEAGIYLQGGWNIKIKDIKATNPGAGLLVAQFCENTLLQNFHMRQNAAAGNASFGRGISIQESPGTVIRDGLLEGYESAAFICEADNPGLLIENVRINNTYSNALRKAFVSLGSTDFIANQISFGGYQHQVYDASQSPGRFKLNNPIFDKGTPFFMYNEQGVDVVVSQGSFTVGDQVFGARKTYTQKLAIPVNGSTAIELPKGWLERFDILVTSTTGITEAYLRRDNSFTNNTSSFHAQLVANSSIRASIGQAFQFATGALIPGNGLNYNYDKGFVISTNSSMAAGQYATVVATYFEPVNAALNAQNATPYDAPLSGGGGGYTPGGSTSQILRGDGAAISSLSQSFITNLTADLAARLPFGSSRTIQFNKSGAFSSDTTSSINDGYGARFPALVAGQDVRIGDTTVYVKKNAYFFGNSITAGYGLTDVTRRYSTMTSAALGVNEVNLAISGTAMVSTSAPLGADSAMPYRVSKIPTYNSATDRYLFFAYGVNDRFHDSALFRSNYNTVIDAATAKGWPTANIVLIGCFLTGNNNPLLPSSPNAYLTEITRQVAVGKGVKFVDEYHYQINHGSLSTVSSDSTHPAYFGHKVITEGIIESLQAPTVGSLYNTGSFTNDGDVLFNHHQTIFPYENSNDHTALTIFNPSYSSNKTTKLIFKPRPDVAQVDSFGLSMTIGPSYQNYMDIFHNATSVFRIGSDNSISFAGVPAFTSSDTGAVKPMGMDAAGKAYRMTYWPGNGGGGGGGLTFPLLAPDGSASAPSYSFTNTANSGMWYNGSGVAIGYNGVTSLDLRGAGGNYFYGTFYPNIDITHNLGAWNNRFLNIFSSYFSPRAGTATTVPYGYDDGGGNHINTGLYFPSGNVGFAVAGASMVQIGANNMFYSAHPTAYTNQSIYDKQSVDSAIAANIGGGSSRRYSAADYVATDANQTAVAGSTLRLPAGTLTANRTIDISALSTEGDYLEIINKEAVFAWSFTGGSVYLSDEVTTVTTLPAVGNFILRVSGGKLQIIN